MISKIGFSPAQIQKNKQQNTVAFAAAPKEPLKFKEAVSVMATRDKIGGMFWGTVLSVLGTAGFHVYKCSNPETTKATKNVVQEFSGRLSALAKSQAENVKGLKKAGTIAYSLSEADMTKKGLSEIQRETPFLCLEKFKKGHEVCLDTTVVLTQEQLAKCSSSFKPVVVPTSLKPTSGMYSVNVDCYKAK
jgi:hypothetical protein